MKTISIEFCLVTFLILLIFLINILHILYLIIYKQNKQIQSIRLILINSSISSLIVSIWLIPCFYFRIQWSSESILWRLWSFSFHIIDAVQIYSLFLLITIQSFQKIFIYFIWLIPIIAYSPLLWLNSSYNQIDYLPYRRLKLNIPSYILPILYFSIYLIPIIISLIISIIQMIYYSKKSKKIIHYQNINDADDEHHKNMIELTDLITTVFNFQLEQSTTNKTNILKTCIKNSTSNKVNRSLSNQIYQHKTCFLFDQFSLIHSSSSSSIQKQNSIEQPFNSYLLFIITCLFLFVHLPYIFLSFFDITSLQLSIFIYIHWFGNLFLPLIHIQ